MHALQNQCIIVHLSFGKKFQRERERETACSGLEDKRDMRDVWKNFSGTLEIIWH